MNCRGNAGGNIDNIRNKDKMVDGRVDMGDRPFIDNINVDKIAAGIITL